MKIYIKTPLYKNSKYVSHLLEHTIGNGGNLKNFFDFIVETDLITFDSYIFYDFPNYLDLDKVKEKIFQKPSKDCLKYEKKVLKDELLETPLKLKIEHKIGKILFGKDFNITKNQKLSNKEIFDYHTKYFNEKNIIVVDDDFNILQDNIFQKNFEKTLDFDLKKIFLKVNKFPCFIFVKKSENYLDYYLFFFLEFFYENLFSYQIRFKEGFYYYEHKAYNYRIYDANIFCLTCEIFDFEEDFFQKAKEKFLEISEKGYGKKWKIICKMAFGDEVDLKKVKKFFDNFSAKDLKNIIGNETDYKKYK